MNAIPGSPSNALREQYLTSRLDELKGELLSVAAPDVLEAKLMAAYRARQSRISRPALWWMPPLALAVTIVLVSWTLRAPLPDTAGADLEGASLAHPAASAVDPGPFLALRPIGRIALEPGATVVATEFPRALLADWGLPVAPERAGEPVKAEMLYSARGEALAVRILH